MDLREATKETKEFLGYLLKKTSTGELKWITLEESSTEAVYQLSTSKGYSIQIAYGNNAARGRILIKRHDGWQFFLQGDDILPLVIFVRTAKQEERKQQENIEKEIEERSGSILSKILNSSPFG